MIIKIKIENYYVRIKIWINDVKYDVLNFVSKLLGGGIIFTHRNKCDGSNVRQVKLTVHEPNCRHNTNTFFLQITHKHFYFWTFEHYVWHETTCQNRDRDNDPSSRTTFQNLPVQKTDWTINGLWESENNWLVWSHVLYMSFRK